MSMPTSWADLDWDKAHPLDYRYMQSLWAAVAERRHVVRRPDAYKLYPNGYRYTPYVYRGPGQPPSREEFVALRDAIYHLCDGLVGNPEGRFLKLDYDYEADDEGWNAWPVHWTREQLTATEERNISWMPDASVYSGAWGGWMRRAKACLDVLVAARSPTWFDHINDPWYEPDRLTDAMWSAKYHEGSTANWTHSTLAAAIAAAKADEAVRTSFYNTGTLLQFYFRRYRSDPDEFYTATFYQRFEWRIMNPTAINALPRLVARRLDTDDDTDVFDGFGYFQLGVNVVEANPTRPHMTPGETLLIDDVADVLEPTVMPTLPQPDDGHFSEASATCDVLSYFDYRCPGGFQFYTPEPEE